MSLQKKSCKAASVKEAECLMPVLTHAECHYVRVCMCMWLCVYVCVCYCVGSPHLYAFIASKIDSVPPLVIVPTAVAPPWNMLITI